MAKLTHEQRLKFAVNEIRESKAEKDNHLSVREANVLIQKNAFDLSLRETKMLYYCIARIKPGDKSQKRYEVNARDFFLACGIDNITGKDYKAFKDTLKDLDAQQFELWDEKGHLHFAHWIKDVEIVPNTGTVKFNFPKVLEPYLFNVADFFTQYQYGNISSMQTKYGINLYRLLRSYANIREKKFDIDKLRWLLGAEEKSYKEKYGIFRAKVIDPAVREINERTDLKADYVEIKDGPRGKVVALKFIITVSEKVEEIYQEQLLQIDKENHPERYTTP